ncbi:MAG: DUF1178 family protein [Gammaproteobacteria bacterium]|nr:DUF1178 family protein [Gammaproteobacteria bacterium]MBU1646611.1 DUF1178 family protein [Gammaproteobacteria bacterium]MBU1972868.1 DUF1178 family protein [Gammaproteobacteria bacterium]
MIVLDLVCGNGHPFEGWLATTPAFDEQVSKGLVGCPHCGNPVIQRVPSGLHLKSAKAAGKEPVASAMPAQSMADIMARLYAKADDVGDRFPEEARRIHHHEVPLRTIRGEASIQEALELLEEGIAVLPVGKRFKETKH